VSCTLFGDTRLWPRGVARSSFEPDGGVPLFLFPVGVLDRPRSPTSDAARLLWLWAHAALDELAFLPGHVLTDAGRTAVNLGRHVFLLVAVDYDALVHCRQYPDQGAAGNLRWYSALCALLRFCDVLWAG